ncbi:MAG: hypothetical protein O3B17_05440 [Actinomycetota bacterium]|nr:hypothetical protein [Actinomycetota bacterium]
MPMDAQFNSTLSNYHLSQTGRALGLKSDFLFGSGTMQWGYLFWLEPTSVIGSLFSNTYNQVFVAVVMSLLLFILTNLVLKSYGQTQTECLIAAYFISISSIWGYSISIVDNDLFAHVPQYASLLSVMLLMLIGFSHIGKGKYSSSIFLSIGLMLGAAFAIMVFPQIIVTAAPLIIAMVGGSMLWLLFAREFKVLFQRVVAIIAIGLFVWGVGAVSFLSGFYRNTAAAEIPITQFNPPDVSHRFKFLFESYFPSPSSSGGHGFQYLSFALLVIYVLRGFKRADFRTQIWFSTLIGAFCVLCYRVYQSQWLFERGPNHNYLVWLMGPLYTAGMAAVFIDIVRSAINKLESQNISNFLKTSKSKLFLIPTLAVLVVVSPLSSIYFVSDEPQAVALDSLKAQPLLVENLSIANNKQFRGRAVYIDQESEFAANISDRIPLLNDYSHNMTPYAYKFYETFFFDSAINQRRNHFIFSMKNLDLYSLLGVKFFVAKSGGSWQNVVSSQSGVIASSRAINDESIIELKNVNVGDYSPTTVFIAKTMAETFRIMRLNDFSASTDVVLMRDLDAKLVPVNKSRLTIMNGDLLVEAESNGVSLIILPLEFSSCLNFSQNSDSSYFLGAQLADGLLTAVVFDKNLDLNIKFRSGLFGNSGCRLEDLQDFREFASQD